MEKGNISLATFTASFIIKSYKETSQQYLNNNINKFFLF